MDLNIQTLPEHNFTPYTEVSYDSKSNNLLVFNPNLYTSINITSQCIMNQQIIYQPKSNSNLTDESNRDNSSNAQPLNTSLLRFMPYHAQSKLLISSTGLVVTSLGKEEEIAVTNFGFNSGTHYWEIIFPKNCNNISVGIIKEGWSIANPANNAKLGEWHQFRTSTPRIVGLKLDLIKKELKCWLNGIFQGQRTKKIEAGTWYPCVKIKDPPGNHIILNPFAVDPESQFISLENCSKIPISHAKITLANWVLVGGFPKTEKSNLNKILEKIDIPESLAPIDQIFENQTNLVALKFKNQSIAEQFCKINQEKIIDGVPLTIIDNLKVTQWGIESIKKIDQISRTALSQANGELLNQMIDWIIKNINKMMNTYEPEEPNVKYLESLTDDIVNRIERFTFSDKKIAAAHDKFQYFIENQEDIQSQYIKASNNLLIAKGNQLKLLTKMNGEFPIFSGIFTNRPRTPKSKILLDIPIINIITLINSMDIKQNYKIIINNHGKLKAFIEFYQAVISAINHAEFTGNDICIIEISYKSIKRVIDALMKIIIDSIKWLQHVIETTKTLLDMKPHDSEPNLQSVLNDDKAQAQTINKNLDINQSILKNLTINSLYRLMSILLTIDEALYAMIKHEDASPKFSSYWKNHNARLFSSFIRLGSFLNYPNSKYTSIIELAEAGIYNASDLLYDVRHFLDPEKKLDYLHNLGPDTNLWNILENSLPDNRMIQGLPSPNIPLHVAVNNLPPQKHSDSANPTDQNNIINVAASEGTTFASTVSGNGDVTIWNTEIALISMGNSNFRKELIPGDISLFCKKSPKSEEKYEDILPGFDFSEPIESQKSQIKAAEPVIVADQAMVEQLYHMGFSVELAKKALILTKNAGLTNALDKLLTLQEEEAKNPSNKNSKTSSILRPKWECPDCTFINVNGNKNCDICGRQAPIEAYYKEEELASETEEESKAMIEEPEKAKVEIISINVNEEKLLLENFLGTSEIRGNLLVTLKEASLCPIIVGVIFQDKEERSMLRLRRFGFTSQLLKQFIVQDPKKGYFSTLNGFWFSANEGCIKEIENHLMNEYGLNFLTLEPLYIGNGRFKELKEKGRNNLFCSDLVAFEEVDIQINPGGRIINWCIVKNQNVDKEQNIYLFVQKNENNELVISHYILKLSDKELNQLSTEEKSFKVELANTIPIGIVTGNTPISIYSINEDLIIINDKYMITINPKTSGKDIVEHGFDNRRARFLEDKGVTMISNDNKFKIIELKKGNLNQTTSLQLPSEVHEDNDKDQKLTKENKNAFKVSELTINDLDKISSLLNKRNLGVELKSKRYDLIGSYIDAQNKLYSKYYMPNYSQFKPRKNYKNIMELQFPLNEKPNILSIELEVHFDYLNSIDKIDSINKEKEYFDYIAKELTKNKIHIGEQIENKDSQVNLINDNVDQNEIKDIGLFNMFDPDNSALNQANYLLPLTVHSYKGAAFNEKFPVSKVVATNNELFCSNYPNAEFIFQHLHEKMMIVNTVIIKSSPKPMGSCGYPIGSGLIFTANHIGVFSKTTEFNDMKHEEYLIWSKNRAKSGIELQPWEPVGSFQFNDKEDTIKFELNHKRAAKYIYLKPTNTRTKPENYSANFKSSPLEIKFFGVNGLIVEDKDNLTITNSSIMHKSLTNEDNNNLNNIFRHEIIIEGKIKDKWINLKKIKVNNINNVMDIYNMNNIKKHIKLLDNIPLWSKNLIELTDENMINNILNIQAIRIIINNNNDGNDNTEEYNRQNIWIINGLTIKIIVSDAEKNVNRSQYSVDNNRISLSSNHIRSLLFNMNKFDEFNKYLILELVNSNTTSEKRKRIMKLIIDIISIEPSFIDKIQETLDLELFILTNILTENDPTFILIRTFLKHIINKPNYVDDLHNKLLKILPKLVNSSIKNLTNIGLNGYFCLFYWCHYTNPHLCFINILEYIHIISKKIKEIRVPEYNILRFQYNISQLSFEKELFINRNPNKKQSPKKDENTNTQQQQQNNNKDIINKQFEPIKCKFLTYYSNDVDEYLFDLQGKYHVKHIRLAFDKSTKSNKFKVQIWNINENTGFKELICSKFYTESTWVQLSQYAYESVFNSQYYSQEEPIECLGFNDINTQGRYILIQITYSLVPSIHPPLDVADKKIIPEFFGNPIQNQDNENDILESENSSTCPRLIKDLKNKFSSLVDLPIVASVNYLHTNKYDYCEVNNCGYYAYIFDSTGTVGKKKVNQQQTTNVESKDKIAQENEELIRDQIRNLQAELASKLNASRNPENFNKIKDEIKDLCDEIETLQISVIGSSSSGVASKSLDFYYTLANNLSKLLRKIDPSQYKEHIPWLKEEKSCMIALDIFETLILYEVHPWNQEYIALLQEVLINNLSEKQRQFFIISIINQFLGTYINITTSPASILFSHVKIIEALNKICTPNSELLAFLISKLNIPIKNAIDNGTTAVMKDQYAEDKSKQLCILASVLIILNNGYKNLALKKKESTDTIDNNKMTYEESLVASFYICVWICDNPNFNDIDKANMLTLALDLVFEILKFSSVGGIKDLLMDPNSFLKLFKSTIKIGSSSLLQKFRNLLDNFLNPKVINPEIDTNILEDIKILLIHHLQTILKALLNYALIPLGSNEQQYNINQNSILIKEDLSPTTWLEHVNYILDCLLLVADKLVPEKIEKEKYTKKTKENKFVIRKKSTVTPTYDNAITNIPSDTIEETKTDLPKLEMKRSLSISQDDSSNTNNLQEFNLQNLDRSSAIPLEIILTLISLLSPNTGGRLDFNFTNSTHSWSLVMKAILKVKVTKLIEANIFDNLINAFLLASEDIQQIMFPEILQLTQSMVNHPNYQKELCNAVLSVVFKTLKSSAQDKYEPITFNLLKGWLDILLTKNTPKPDDFYLKPLDKAFCKLNAQGALNLLVNLSTYLWNHLNIGGKDGALNCSELNVVKLQIADDLLKLLISSESNSNLFAIGELFSNFKKYQHDIKNSLQIFIDWYLLNRSLDTLNSPSTDVIKSISDSLSKMFIIIGEFQEVAKVSIGALIQACKSVDKTLLKMLSTQQLSSYSLLQYNSRNCKILEELFDIWVTNDTIASYVAFDAKGFEYLLDRMGVASAYGGNVSTAIKKDSDNKTSLLEGTDLFEYIQRTKEENKTDNIKLSPGLHDASSNINEDPKEEEFANKLTIINQPGQNHSGITPDWSINKKGVRARIMFFVMNGQFYNEYCLVFNLDKQIELKHIRIGFNTVWTDYSDKVLGVPSSVLVEGGIGIANLTPIGTLMPINDEGYTNFSVKVFHKNFNQLKGGNNKSIEESIQSLQSKRVSTLKFRFRRPIVTFIESYSLLTGKQYKHVAVSISFISITGFDVNKLPNTRKKIVDTQENSALQVIGKLCNQNFSETLAIFANQQDVISKIKSSFDTLASLLVPHESWVAPVFMAVACHNYEMGDWIISKFLDIAKSREHAKMIGDIILSNNDRIFTRLIKLHEFVFNELKKVVNSNTNDSMNKFNSLIPFIETLCTVIRSIPSDISQKYLGDNLFIIEFKQEDIDNIIQSYENFNASNNVKQLIKLIVLYLYILPPFTIKDQSMLKYTLEKLWTLITKESKTLFYEMLGPIIIGSNSASKWFINYLDVVLSDILFKLDNIQGGVNTKYLRHSLILLNNISNNEIVKKRIAADEWYIKFYQSLKNKDPNSKTVLKEFDPPELLALSLEFLKNIVVGYHKTEEEMARLLKEDLSLLENKRDLYFVNNLLVPLLNAENNVPVCLHPYDSQSKKIITDNKKLETASVGSTSGTANEFIKTSLLSNKQSQILHNTIKNFTTASGFYRKMTNSTWTLGITTSTDGENVLQSIGQKLSKQGPFLLIMEGPNNGKKCVIGAFSSQPFPELPAQFDTSLDQVYQIPLTDDCFLFYYDDDYTLHFPIPSNSTQTSFGQITTFYEGGGGISFSYNNIERIFLSCTPGQASYIDFNLMDMSPIETINVPLEISYDFFLKTCEYWIYKPGTAISTINRDKKKGNILANMLFPAWYNPNQPLNYYRTNPVYNVPSSIGIGKLSEIVLSTNEIPLISRLTHEQLDNKTNINEFYEFVKKDPQTNGIIDLEFDANIMLEKQQKSPSLANKDQNKIAPEMVKYMPAMTIFEAFEKNEGVESIINVTLKSLTIWKDKEKAKRWFTWVQELSSFSSLPNFFGLFLKNKRCIELLFQILAGVPDEEAKKGDKMLKKWEEEEQQAVKFSYQILADVFAVDSDIKGREFALEKNFIDRILDRISLISKEFKRKYVKEIVNEKVEETSPDKIDKKKNEEEDVKKKVAKKKGVGYGSDNTGQNQKWNVNEYVESRKVKNEQLSSMIDILYNFLNFKKWNPPKKVYEIICESSLLPLLEAAFRSGSLLDMGKEADLYFSYLKLAKAIALHKSLVPCLMDLDKHYQPQQKDSIYTLLKSLKDIAQIFINCLTSASDSNVNKETTATNQKLANEIVETFQIVDDAIQAHQESLDESEEVDLTDILNSPLPVAYKTLLKDLRFDYMNMKDQDGKYKHHYGSYITSNFTPPPAKMVRLAQELADLSSALPIEHTNSIFVRVDQSRVDVMKGMIMGASGTPYAHGAYEYDIYFDDQYPNAPPKVNLETTGGGKVRFNPNLYNCGKVCLSLLGTWRGNASENWDPKLSTLLQVLVSVQAIIMSDDVYFNEPGFEGEAGTEEGERKNEAYSNIVRYCNIRFAMIDNLKNPPKGFETVIKRHFYLKKNEILDECRKWIKYAEAREASYNGLVNDHNHNWSSEFKQSKHKYRDMLVEAVKELEIELNKLTPPSGKDLHKKVVKKKEKKIQSADANKGITNIEEIDVSYDKEIKTKDLDINEAGVKDRWSRYIGAMGMDAVAKQANSSIFLSGLGALGIEIAKNVVLSGVKRFTIHDNKKTSWRDLSGQFFLNEDDIGKNRAQASLTKIQQLNYYVKVDTALLDKSLPTTNEEIEKLLKGYTCVVLLETDYQTQVAIGNYCHKNKIYFISAECYGPFSRTFCDFGEQFVVNDKNGEEVQEVMIKSITNEENGLVTLLDGIKHKFEDGDEVLITAVEGMATLENKDQIVEKTAASSINNTKHKVKVINAQSFRIGDTRGYSKYVRNGIAKQLKIPLMLKFSSFEESIISDKPPMDNNMLMADFLKISHPKILHIAFETLNYFQKKYNRLPHPWNFEDSNEFLKLASESAAKRISDYKPQEDKRYEYIMRRFAFTCTGVFSPLAAFMGGYVSQEIIKAITNKFMPTRQFFYTDCYEVIPDLPDTALELEQAIKSMAFKEETHRSAGLKICVVDKLYNDLAHSNLFMVGAGAIGCELLKNYAMLGLGTGEAGKDGYKQSGLITLTDPDVIEISNLNRQFLFREKHLRKPKSQTAAAAALQMNKELKGHVVARLDKVHEGTSHIFTDKFFEELSVVTNALDNIQARRYVDMRCVSSKTPLLESGTLGPKGHVQVIIPYKTESYGSQQDPQEEGEIPHCTLKMFPEETLHCVEWARDKFGKLYTQRPKGLNKLLEDPNFKPTNSQELKTLREAITLLKKRPITFDDCLHYARKKFEKYFVNDIRQLLFTYPLDAKTKQGAPFWSLPKRPPGEIIFDPKNPLHASFIAAAACLRASIFNIPFPVDARNEAGKKQMADEAYKFKISSYKPSEEKKAKIAAEVDKDTSKTEENKEEENTSNLNEYETALNEFQALIKNLQKDKNGKILGTSPEEFEKDNDSNFHIDFIHAMANCRSSNYKLEPMDWITVKLKAGRIIPALATTTAAIAGLQTIELCKLLKKCKVEDMKNAFLSLAVPILALSEPGPAPVTKLTEKLKVSIWDRWEIKTTKDYTLKQLFENLETQYDLKPKDVMAGSQPVYFSAIMDIPGKEKEKQDMLNKKLIELLGLEKEDKYIDLTITFCAKEGGDILKGVPPVRLYIDQKTKNLEGNFKANRVNLIFFPINL